MHRLNVVQDRQPIQISILSNIMQSIAWVESWRFVGPSERRDQSCTVLTQAKPVLDQEDCTGKTALSAPAILQRVKL